MSLFKKYKVDYCGREQDFSNAKRSYRPGERVRLIYGIIATDTDYSFSVDGKPVSPGYSDDKGFIIEFTMPDHDVTITVESRNTMEMN